MSFHFIMSFDSKFSFKHSMYFSIFNLFSICTLLLKISKIRLGDLMNSSPFFLSFSDLHRILMLAKDGTHFMNYWITSFYCGSTSLRRANCLNFFDRIVLKFVFKSVVSSLWPLKIYFRLVFFYSSIEIVLFVFLVLNYRSGLAGKEVFWMTGFVSVEPWRSMVGDNSF